MNILFISFDSDPPNCGGVATVASILANYFISKGHTCSLGFPFNSEYPSDIFKNKILINKKNTHQISEFFKTNRFDIALVMLPINLDYKLLKKHINPDCKIISAYHSKPMLHSFSIEVIARELDTKRGMLYKIYTYTKYLMLPYYFSTFKISELLKINTINQKSDIILLLSERYFKNWEKLSFNFDKSKLFAINNPKLYEDFISNEEFEKKEKILLAVCNFESIKRIHIMVEIWEQIEKNELLKDWEFQLIGSGFLMKKIQQLIEKKNLERIFLLGTKNPSENYKKSKIIINTSKTEGWPLSITEAQQMGVVPITFDSFEAVHEMIKDNFSGIIVKNNDKKAFVKRLEKLMIDNARIDILAKNAIVASKKINNQEIFNTYLNLFEKLSLNK